MISAARTRPLLRFEVGSKPITQVISQTVTASVKRPTKPRRRVRLHLAPELGQRGGAARALLPLNVNPKHTFDNFVEVIQPTGARGGSPGGDNPGGATTLVPVAVPAWVKLTCCTRGRQRHHGAGQRQSGLDALGTLRAGHGQSVAK